MTKFNASLTTNKNVNDEKIKNELLTIVDKAYGFKLKEKKNEEVKKGSFFVISGKAENEIIENVKKIEGVTDIKLKLVNDVVKKKEKKVEEKSAE